MKMTLDTASAIIDAALKTGREKGFMPLSVAVLDAGGHLVAFKREDKSGILRFDIAFGKAWGALGMGFGSDGDVIGAVGVSGDNSDNDEICAVAGIAAVGLDGKTGL